MRRAVLAFSVASLAIFSGAAVAADFPRGPTPYYDTPTPMSSSGYNWSGFYAGLNGGYQWGRVTNSAVDPSGFLGGVQVGYNWQSGQFVFGGEGDIQASDADDTFANWKFSNPWFGTARARVGFAISNALLYGTAGLAIGDLKAEFGGLSETKTLFGWVAGGGLEVGFTPNWSAKIEYLYMDLGNRNYAITGVDNGLQSSMVRFGINYRF